MMKNLYRYRVVILIALISLTPLIVVNFLVMGEDFLKVLIGFVFLGAMVALIWFFSPFHSG